MKVPYAHLIIFSFSGRCQPQTFNKIIKNILLWPNYCCRWFCYIDWNFCTCNMKELNGFKISKYDFLKSDKHRKSIPVNILDALVFACLGLMLTVYDMMITLLLTLSVIYAGLRNWPWYGADWFIWPKWT